MKINAGLLSLALAGFSTLSSAQHHGKNIRGVHVRRARALRERDMYTEVKTEVRYTTIYANPDPEETPHSPPQNDFHPKVVTDDTPTPTPTLPPPTIPTPSSSISAPVVVPTDNSYSGGGDGIDTNPDTDKEFKDGVVPCSKFPSDHGAVPLPWWIKKGWSGIQVGNANGDAHGECVEGALCSYACPAGYSKAQWPAEQPSNGESRGGLLCRNGFLTLTRPEYKYLCQAGESGITIKNDLSEVISVCRTDYPGSENMVIPLQCDPGTNRPLAVPDSSNSYVWQGKATSAQYYVNPAGVDVKKGCKWGNSIGSIGNWAPLVIGAGKADGKIWLSISQNQLNDKRLDYNIEIIGGSMKCECIDGVFTKPQGASDESEGCTVAVDPGQKAYFRIFPRSK